jgi:hypothetical protein
LELLLVLLQDALIMVLPELLAGVLSSHSLNNLLATRMLFLVECVSKLGELEVRPPAYLELGHVVDIIVDNDPEVIGLVVRLHIGFGVCARHDV